MKPADIKFRLDFNSFDIDRIGDIFNNAKYLLNFQLDNDFNISFIDSNVDYQFRDVSNLSSEDIGTIDDSFFDFTFEDIFNVFLYRFLVLKNNEKLTILAIINSSIFDYSSINDFYELFDNQTNIPLENNLTLYYEDVKDYLDSSDFEKDSNYWRNYILDSSNYLIFHNLKGNNYKSRLLGIDRDAVSDFIENHDCSLFDFYGSIFSLYLARVNRQKGCLLKTIVPRNENDSKSFDKNTLLKIDIDDNCSFADLLNEFDSNFSESINYTKVDVDNYVDETSYYSIYDFHDLNENIHVYNGESSAFTLNIYGNSLEIVYNSDLFEEVFIEHMTENIESLINNILNSHDQILGDIDILSNEEKALLLDFCKGKTVEFDKNKFLSNAFRENAINFPDDIAVDDGINKITFGELEKSSNSIAYDLHEIYGIGLGSRVAILLPRSYRIPELVLALNKIGATFVPIDLFYPIKRIEYMLNMSQTEFIVTTEEIANSFDLKEGVIHIEDLNDNNEVDVDIVTRGEDLFIILFTSGTTGLPKGVMITNNQTPGIAISFREIFNYSQGDVIGHYLGFTFVASFVVYAALYFGGCCRIFNEIEQKDSLLLIKELKENHMNSLILPPNIGIPIYENEDLQLDYLVLAGAKLNELSKKEKHTKLVNFYGTTEIVCGATKVYSSKDIADNNVPLGRPVANSWIYILDENNNQMPIGVPGEICVSNNFISQGYLNNRELTDKVFIDNPYSAGEVNKRMYRTGDIGFYNFDGELEIIGREDNQLSVRGFRIESGEILNIMKCFNEISDIYLDVDNDTLIAYYTTSDDLDINEVKEALKINLPYYMVPSLFIELDKIPLSANGKIDKSSLKTAINDEDIEIADEVLRCVVDSFKEVLNLEYVLIDDGFVALGGNSLSAMKLQLLLKEKLNVYLSSNELISLSTPKNIADHIKFNLKIHSTIDDERYTFDELCPLSESQLNVYLDESVNSMGTAYNNSFKMEFNDNYSADEIKNALIKLFEVFPILKARVLNNTEGLFFAFDGEPEIIEGYLDDIKSFVRQFEMDKYLSRFLIVENSDSIILCADFHHLIFDGTSLNILLNKLISILNGEDIDFVDNGVLRQVSFEENIDADYMDAAKEFFNIMLADVDEVQGLLPCVDGDGVEFELIDTFDFNFENLNSFLQNHSITYNQFFTSVFAYTLSKFSGSEKVLFNLVEDGRGHMDLSESVGMFVKTLPVLMDCKNSDVDSYLNYSSNLINSVMKYDLYPFRILANKYNLDSNVLFQYSHNLFSDVINKDYLEYYVDELDHDLTADLSFYIFNNGEDKLTIRIFYSSLYSKSLMEHFVESYKLILHEMINVDELGDIHYTSGADFELLDGYNQTEYLLDYEDVLDAFNDNLSECPDNNLVSYKGKIYSYGEGAYLADKIAKKLVDLGVESQDCVAFLTDRSEYYLFSVLGIMSIGGVYVPLDGNLPDERIGFMIKDTKSKVLIVSDGTYERAVDLGTAENCIILNISDIVEGEIKSLTKLDTVYGDLACILYTSGSTGVPKGVKITRKAILNFVEFYVNDSGINSDDVYGLFASIGFDVAIKGIFSSIYSGACLNIIPDDIKLDMDKLNKYFQDYGITHTHITTQVAKLFINSNSDISLTELVTGGEKLGEINNVPNCRFIDTYGPTEACVYVTSINNESKVDSSSVGHLLNNLKAYILDDEGRRVPIGAVGELYLAGYQIADGYLNREDETHNAFVDNSFDDEDGYNVMYRTGDMVRLLPDGSLDIVDRRDGQVKVRGNRVELSEIESVIRELDYISDVTVQTIKNGSNNEVVAYVVASHEIEDIMGSVCEYVNKYKPDYMVPSFVIQIDSIPLNVNGKVDKRALPEVDLDNLRAEYVAPTNETEKQIVEAFEKVFNLDRIGIHDDFVSLGGDSLTAIKLLPYLDDYNITAADVLSLHTPHAIAENIKGNHELDLNIYTLESGCPLNEPQLNVYLDIVANNKIDSYLIPFVMGISKEYGVNDVCDALNTVLDAHPILRMCISDDFDVPYLVKARQPSISVESNLDHDFIVEFLTEPFDLHDSLSRFLIVDDGDEDSYTLFAVFHHIVFDALSDSVFKHDLQSVLEGKSVTFDDSFLKVSAFNTQIKKSEEYLDANDFYESMLVDSDDAGVLLDSIGADGPGSKQINLDLDNDLFKSFLTECGVSENVVFTGAFAYTLSRFVGSEQVWFNIVENGRDRFNNYDSIGMYVNTLPLLVDCKNRDISSFMDYMSGLVYDVMRYNYYPFRLLANRFGIDSNILFQFLPEWIKDDEKDILPINIEKEEIIKEMDDLITDFSVNVIQNDNEYSLSIRYSDKYSSDFVERFMESYKLILNEALKVSELVDINYIAEGDVELLNKFNSTGCSLVYDDVLDAYNDNLAKYPNNNLVSMNDTVYSYGQGAYIADKIANELRNLSVDAEDCVGFLTERSEYYMFAVLGILSMGGVYVPLDENLPDERIRFILKDTGASVIIVSDETYVRAKNIIDDEVQVLNISDMLKEDVGVLDCLPVVYGDLACILYTSGTTGVPKGVKITRKAILNFVEFYVNESGINSDDVYGLFASIGFDVAIKGIFSSIYSGACLNIIPEDIKLDMNKLNKYFCDYGITHTHITTQVAKLFINENSDIALSELVTGGEKLGEINDIPNCRFIDTYGPTEACVYVTSINNENKIDSSSVGHLLNNMRAYILDDDGRRVPIGAVGELYLAGYQIADGYLNRDDETYSKFIDNSFDDEEDYNVMYRTGDMVRLLPDGSLDIVGRRDGQVKVRGNRVELSEIESVIRELDYVSDVTVQTIKNGSNNEVVAYVVVSHEIEDIMASVCEYVNKYKPDYMVPSFVIQIDSIPLNVNGKVDKRALPEVDLDNLRAEYVAPTNETEKAIVEAFENVFNQDRIGIHDDFVRLGGDSLMGIRLLSSLENHNINLADVLSLRTPQAIANKLDKNKHQFDLDVYSLESGCPLNESQLNVYLDILANDKVDSYLMQFYMDISKKYDVEDIIRALNEMLDVHPILNMCVSDEFDVPYLIKGSKPEILVESNVNDEYIVKFLTKSFDLHDCLCRFLIVENKENYELIGSFHHIIFDALSHDIFKDDFQSILDGELVEVDDTFLKVSAFAQQIGETDEFDEADSFYESMLVDADEVDILLDDVLHDGPDIKDISLDLDSELLKSFLDRHGVSPNVLFTGVFAYTLSRFVGGNNVLFNLTENGRDRFGSSNSIGMYVNTLPILVDCKNQDISSFMDYMADLMYDVMRYDYYPFRLLANKYDINSKILFQFLPEWIKDYEYYDEQDGFNTASYGRLLQEMDDVIADLYVVLNQTSEEYVLKIVYSNKYSGDFVNRFLESYKLILHEMLNADNLSDINQITTAADIELLDSYNQTEHDLDYYDVLDAFNDNVSRYPNNKLVLSDEASYTYAEGAYLINQIQTKLKNNNVDVNDKVCVFVDRGCWILLANMAVLAQGATYVPIDENHPDARIEYMVEKSQSKAIIVSDTFQERVNDIIAQSDLNPIVINISSLDGEGNELTSLSYVDPSCNDVACILFTSGTTGNPKAVQVGRFSIANMVSFYADNFNFTSSDIYGVFASVGFDISLQHYAALLCGGAVTWVPNDVRLNINKLNEYFIKYNVTHTIITTQVSKLFVKNISNTSIKNLSAVGEKMGQITAPEGYDFLDVYGPTEATSSMTSIIVKDKIEASSVGGPDWNTKIYVLDNEQRRVPLGAAGELYISGYQVSKGYLNNSEENKKAFFENPFDGDLKGYERMYKTGDLVRLLPDGTIGFIGRNDSQVKVRGNRLELSEVEATIRELDYVDDVTVQTVKIGENNDLVAYVVSSVFDDEDSIRDSIQEYVADRKPDYMIPSFVIKLDEIPLNVNGKVDKRALPDVDRDSLYEDYVAPRNENEKEIVEAFEKALNLENIGIYDDFIRLGGDSLTAIKLLSYIKSNNVAMADIFTFRTPEAIAKNMPDYSFDLDLYSLESGCPLNSAQVNVFADLIVYNKKDAYHVPGYVRIPKEYGLENILNALNELLNAHPILIMRLSEVYEENAGEDINNWDLLKDLITTAKKFGINEIMNLIKSFGLRDMGGLYNMIKTIIRLFKGESPYLVKGAEPQISVELDFDEDIIIDFFAERFNIYDSLSRFMIVEFGDSYYLFYVIHHLIFDATSAGIFKKDLFTLLDGGSVNLDDAFLKSSAFTHQIKSTDKFDEAAEFYEPILSDIDDINMFHGDTSAEGYSMSSYALEFDKIAFKSFLNKAGISENILFNSVLSYTLSQFVDSDKVIYILIENGRDMFNENFIGMTSNVMPVVADCSNQSIDSFMRHMSDRIYGVSRHSYYPLLFLYQKYNFEVNVMFQFVPNWIADDFDDFDDFDGLENVDSHKLVNQVLNKFGDSLADVFVQIYQNGENYRMIFTYSNMYSDKLIKDFKDTYVSILSKIINADMSSKLSFID